MPIPSFPQEILDKIIDNFGRGRGHNTPDQSFRTLKSLALASRCFVNRSYSHLFEEVHFDYDEEGKRETKASKKLKVFKRTPELCKYIRWYRAETIPILPGRTKIDNVDPRLLASQRSMLNIARISGGVTEVHIAPRVELEHPIPWASLSPTVREAFEVLFQTNPLISITILHIRDFPVQLLINLKTPHILRLKGRSSVGLVDGEPSSQPSWELTSYVYESQLLRNSLKEANFNTVLRFSRLVDLQLTIYSMKAHTDAWSTILSPDGRPETLQSLRLNYPLVLVEHEGTAELEESGRSLPTFPYLRSLFIDVSCRQGPEDVNILKSKLDIARLPGCLPRFLSTLLGGHTQPLLKVFSVAVWYYTGQSTVEVISQKTSSQNRKEWKRLDGIISSPSMFPSIPSIAFSMHYHCLDGHSGHRAKKDMERTIRELKESHRSQLLEVLPQTARRLQGVDIRGFDVHPNPVDWPFNWIE